MILSEFIWKMGCMVYICFITSPKKCALMAIWRYESRQFRQFVKITLAGLLVLSFTWAAAALPSNSTPANPDSVVKLKPRLVLSHNLSGWATGYSGPEFEFRVRYWNGPPVLAGFQYAYYQPFGQRRESFSLRNYYPQLKQQARSCDSFVGCPQARGIFVQFKRMTTLIFFSWVLLKTPLLHYRCP